MSDVSVPGEGAPVLDVAGDQAKDPEFQGKLKGVGEYSSSAQQAINDANKMAASIVASAGTKGLQQFSKAQSSIANSTGKVVSDILVGQGVRSLSGSVPGLEGQVVAGVGGQGAQVASELGASQGLFSSALSNMGSLTQDYMKMAAGAGQVYDAKARYAITSADARARETAYNKQLEEWQKAQKESELSNEDMRINAKSLGLAEKQRQIEFFSGLLADAKARGSISETLLYQQGLDKIAVKTDEEWAQEAAAAEYGAPGLIDASLSDEQKTAKALAASNAQASLDAKNAYLGTVDVSGAKPAAPVAPSKNVILQEDLATDPGVMQLAAQLGLPFSQQVSGRPDTFDNVPLGTITKLITGGFLTKVGDGYVISANIPAFQFESSTVPVGNASAMSGPLDGVAGDIISSSAGGLLYGPAGMAASVIGNTAKGFYDRATGSNIKGSISPTATMPSQPTPRKLSAKEIAEYTTQVPIVKAKPSTDGFQAYVSANRGSLASGTEIYMDAVGRLVNSGRPFNAAYKDVFGEAPPKETEEYSDTDVYQQEVGPFASTIQKAGGGLDDFRKAAANAGFTEQQIADYVKAFGQTWANTGSYYDKDGTPLNANSGDKELLDLMLDPATTQAEIDAFWAAKGVS